MRSLRYDPWRCFWTLAMPFPPYGEIQMLVFDMLLFVRHIFHSYISVAETLLSRSSRRHEVYSHLSKMHQVLDPKRLRIAFDTSLGAPDPPAPRFGPASIVPKLLAALKEAKDLCIRHQSWLESRHGGLRFEASRKNPVERCGGIRGHQSIGISVFIVHRGSATVGPRFSYRTASGEPSKPFALPAAPLPYTGRFRPDHGLLLISNLGESPTHAYALNNAPALSVSGILPGSTGSSNLSANSAWSPLPPTGAIWSDASYVRSSNHTTSGVMGVEDSLGMTFFA